MRQIIDVKTIGEALRLLLIERGVFSDADYLKVYERAADLLQKDLASKLEQAGQLQMLKALDLKPGQLH